MVSHSSAQSFEDLFVKLMIGGRNFKMKENKLRGETGDDTNQSTTQDESLVPPMSFLTNKLHMTRTIPIFSNGKTTTNV